MFIFSYLEVDSNITSNKSSNFEASNILENLGNLASLNSLKYCELAEFV